MRGAMARSVVTISASYGASGSQIGRELARRLGARFFDRAIPAEVARRLAVPLERALAHDEAAPSGIARVLHSCGSFMPWPGQPPSPSEIGERAFRAETERIIHEAADTGTAVLLGRAAALVLGDAPGTLHVRLDGPQARRIEQAMRAEGIDRETARRRLRESDRARDAYVRHAYGADPHDDRLYHLVVDSTALDPATCVDLLTLAALARSEPPAHR